jgi:hypothetical protein
VPSPEVDGVSLRTNNIKNGAIILNEGLRGTDNASITKYDLISNACDNFYFRKANPNLKLGDNANDIIIYDTMCYVSVSGASTIEVFALNNGKSKGRIIFPNFVMPRKLCFVNDTLAFVTAYKELRDENYVYYFNPSDLVISQQNINDNKIIVGSHPEGICYDSLNKLLYVVNSGYGDLDCEHPKASTISVIDITTKTEINNFKLQDSSNKIYHNPCRIYYNNGKIYVVAWGLPSDTSAIKGAVLEYNQNTLMRC